MNTNFKKIVVYGTLKEGFSNSLANYGGHKLANVELNGWEMYTNSWYPQVIPGNGKIVAELWEVPPNSIDELDSYEGHPSLFKRTPIPELDAEMYVFQRSVQGHLRLQSGIFE